MNREPIRRGRSPSSVALLVLAAIMTSVAAARAEDPSGAPGSANGAEGQTVGHDHDHGSAASDVPKSEEKDAGTPGPGPTTPHMHDHMKGMHDQMNDMHDSIQGGGDGAHDSAPHSGQ